MVPPVNANGASWWLDWRTAVAANDSAIDERSGWVQHIGQGADGFSSKEQLRSPACEAVGWFRSAPVVSSDGMDPTS